MGRKKESRIYALYDYDENTKKSKCLVEGCNVYIKGNHGGNLLRHFYSKHKAKHDEILSMNIEDKENVPARESDTANAVMKYCIELVTIHGRPFNLVEDEAFKNILNMIPGMTQRNIQAINVKNIKENIRRKAYDVRLDISTQLNSKLVALKIDVASIKLRRFLGLNVQYISGSQIILRNLSVVELHDRNTAQYLKENVMLVLSRYGIEPNQILTITTDNGANMLSMINELNETASQPSVDLSDSTDEISDVVDENIECQIEEEDGEIRKITGIRCAAHCLQLAIKAACQEISEFLEQCRRIIKKLRTPNMSLRLKENNLPQAMIDTPVRWDSTADMLQNLQQLKPFCTANIHVEAGVWTDLDKYLQILLPCRILSKCLQSEQLTCGDFYLAWIRCRHHLNQINDPFAHQLEACMIARQVVLFENDHFLAALYLDPRVNSVLNSAQATSARNFLLNVHKRLTKLMRQPQASTSASGTELTPGEPEARPERENFEDYLRNQFVNNDRMNISLSLENEIIFKLVAFLEEPLLPADSNILQYWAGKKMTHPYLFSMATVVLATPPTSVSVERLFSSLKFVLNNLRMRLNDAVIEDVMLVRNNHLYSK